MKIIDAINEVCDVVSLDRFGSVYGSNNAQAQTMLEMAKLAGQEISRRFDWKSLEKTVTVSATPFPLPDDFDRLIDGGAIFSNSGGFYRPVKNPSQWAVVKQVPSAQRYFFLTKKNIEFSPAADATTASVTYISDGWIIGDDQKSKSDWGSDDDTTAFPDHLLVLNMIWRWKRQKGLSYDDPLAEFEAALGAATEDDRG